MEFIDSSSARRRSWFVSLARRKDGDDMELNSCTSFELVTGLIASRNGVMLLITASRAGYIAVSLLWLVVIRL